eukprot:m.48242 g.48242  ORF g.48242 m.48242 type:complete len:128 (+) comp10819_c1_seq3:118-501(+)
MRLEYCRCSTSLPWENTLSLWNTWFVCLCRFDFVECHFNASNIPPSTKTVSPTSVIGKRRTEEKNINKLCCAQTSRSVFFFIVEINILLLFYCCLYFLFFDVTHASIFSFSSGTAIKQQSLRNEKCV